MKKSNYISPVLSALISVICLILMYIFPQIIKSTVREALNICAFSLIPSLFPFIVSTKICADRIMNIACLQRRNIYIHLLGVSLYGLIIHILGLISGYPNGAMLSGVFYSKGIISRDEANKLLLFSNCISPAFCIVLFGKTIVSSTLCGILAFICVLLSNLICMLGYNLITRKQINVIKISDNLQYKKEPISRIIIDSAGVMLNICAYVTYFLCIGKITDTLIEFYLSSAETFSAVISGIFEVSGGIMLLEDTSFGKILLVGCFLLSFGGISAAMQVMSFAEKYGLSTNNYLMIKTIQALLSPFLFCVLVTFIPCFTEIFLYIRKHINYGILFTIISIAAAIISIFTTYRINKNKKSIF